MRSMASGKLYVIQHNHSNYYKIGLTTGSVAERLKKLQTGNPYRLYKRLEMTVLDVRLAETILHQKYHKYRGIGEWFFLDSDEAISELLTYILNDLSSDIQHRLLLKDINESTV